MSRFPHRFSLLVALLLLTLACQRFYNLPVAYSWEIGVGVTEWGHWLALVAMLLAIALQHRGTRACLALTTILSLQPALSASLASPGFSWPRLFQADPGGPPPLSLQVPEGEMLDFYPADKNRPTPLILVVHGGSWARGSRSQFRSLNYRLQAEGYSVASLDYRLAPAHPYPAASQDLDRAYDYLIENAARLSIDPTRVAWLGRSAGGHLALLQAYGRRPSQAVVAYYPPTDLHWSYEHPSNPRVLDSCQAIRDFLGATPQSNPTLYTEASPLALAHSGAPPTLLVHGLSDDLVYPVQSQRLAARLEQLQVPWRLCQLRLANHGFDIHLNGPSGQLATHEVLDFLAAHLKSGTGWPSKQARTR